MSVGKGAPATDPAPGHPSAWEPTAGSYRVGGLYVAHAPALAAAVPPAPAPTLHASGRPPLLLVHGAGHGAWCWEFWLSRLPALGWETHALSLRNHPPSDAVPEQTFLRDLRVADYAADVRAVADSMGRPCIVVGHSMGGIVSQAYAAQATAAQATADSKPPAALVLLASVPPGQLGPIRDTPIPEDAPFATSREVAAQRYFHSSDHGVVQAAVARIVGESPSVMNEISLPPGVRIAPDALGCPLLVVTAGQDGTAVPKDGRIAEYYGASRYSAAHMHREAMGHDLMYEAGWETLLDDILAWAETHTGRG